MRLAVVRAEQERLAREEAERKKQEQAARHPQRKGYGGATRVKGERRLRPKLLTITGLAVALAAAAFFIGRYALERRGPLPPAVVPAPKTESVPPETARREPPPTSTEEGTGNISAPNTENPREPLAPSLSAKPSTIPAPKSESPARLEPPPETGIVKNPAVQKPSVPQLRVRTNPKDGLRYVWTPPGTFTMGCSPGDSERHDDEKPAHRVTITKGFWLGQTEVTQAPYQRVVGTNSSYFKGTDLPVEEVSWDQAQAYCQAIGGRLPTEAEGNMPRGREACRAGTAISTASRGTTATAEATPTRSRRRKRTRGGCTTCWGMSGSGRQTGTEATRRAQPLIRRDPYPGNLERCGAGLGTMVRGTRACRTVAGSSQATVTTISGCGARGNKFPLLFFSFSFWITEHLRRSSLNRRRSRRRFFLRDSKDGNKAEALRGGSWNNNPRNARVSNRNRNEPGNRNNNIGLRCAGDAGNACQTGKRREPDGITVPPGVPARFRALVPASRASGAPNINLLPALW